MNYDIKITSCNPAKHWCISLIFQQNKISEWQVGTKIYCYGIKFVPDWLLLKSLLSPCQINYPASIPPLFILLSIIIKRWIEVISLFPEYPIINLGNVDRLWLFILNTSHSRNSFCQMRQGIQQTEREVIKPRFFCTVHVVTPLPFTAISDTIISLKMLLTWNFTHVE